MSIIVTQLMVVSFVFIWLNTLILHCKYNIVSSRGTVQSDYDTVDGISLNPAYGGKSSNSTIIISHCNDSFVFYHAVSYQDMPKDNYEAPDYMIV